MTETNKQQLEAAIRVLQGSSRGRRVMIDLLDLLNADGIAGLDQYGQHAAVNIFALFFSAPMTVRDTLQDAIPVKAGA